MAANDDFLDEQLRRAVRGQTEIDTAVGSVKAVISPKDAEFVRWFRGRFNFTSRNLGQRRYKLFLQAMSEMRTELHRLTTREIRDNVRFSVLNELEAQREILESTIPLEAPIATVTVGAAMKAGTSQAFQGKTFDQWLGSYRAADRSLILDAVQNGMAINETPTQVARRLSGTAAANFGDGALFKSRAHAQAIAQTSMTHFNQVAREEFYKANDDLVAGMRWVATLDSKTTRICSSRDNKIVTLGDEPAPPNTELLVPQDARPPAHVNCRSVMVGFYSGRELTGRRPFVIATAGDKAKVDFRKIARQQGIKINTARRRWAEQNVGTVAADVDYEDFLRRQSASFQDQAFKSQTKGALFRRGGLDLGDFVNGRTGRELTVPQLRLRHPDAFTQANLD